METAGYSDRADVTSLILDEKYFPRHRRLGRFREFENVVPDQVWDRQRGRFTELTGVEEAEFVAKPNIHRVEYRGEEVSETRAASSFATTRN